MPDLTTKRSRISVSVPSAGIAFFLAIAAIACGTPKDDTVPDGASPDSRVIVVLGSSTAQGVGPTNADSTWVNRFRVAAAGVDARYDILNLGRGGYTTYQIIPSSAPPPVGVPPGRPAVDPERNIDAALASNPVAVIVNMPSNDAASGFTVDEQMRNFNLVAAAAEHAGVPMWITTPMPRALSVERTRAQLALKDALYERFGDRVIDFWEGFATEDGDQRPEWDSGDNLHYNDAAHRIFAERVAQAMLGA